MNTLFAVTILGVAGVIVGIPLILNRAYQRKAQQQRERAERLRAARGTARKDSSATLPAVQRSRMATPVGVRK